MKWSILPMLALILVTTLAVPSDVSAQGRGRGRGRGISVWGNKCDKFINCHDARDGRVDGRGPNRTLSLRDRIFGRSRVYRTTRGRRVSRIDRFDVPGKHKGRRW
jgi:hypothetical protein